LGLDWGELTGKLYEHYLHTADNATQGIGIMYAHGKPNVQCAKGTRPPGIGEDELAIKSVGFVML